MQNHPSRFECPSTPLQLGHLVRKAAKSLWLASAFAIAIHLSFTQWASFTKARTVAKPLTTQFVKRQPRLTKPLELKKRPRPKRRPLQRRMISVKAKMDWQCIGATIAHTTVLQNLARPQVNVSRGTAFGASSLEPAALATLEPMTHLSSASLLISHAMDRKHIKATMDADSLRRLIGWVDANGPYLGEEEIRQMPDPTAETRWAEPVPVVKPRLRTAPRINRFNIQQDGDSAKVFLAKATAVEDE